MTIFSLPRPFVDTDKGKFKTIQENAMMSWKLTHPDTEILVFGNELGVHQVCDRLKFKHIPEVKVNNFGTPYLNDLFEQAQEIASSSILCYLHSDIIMIEDMNSMIKEISKQFSKFLLLARRWDLFSKWNGTVKDSIEYSLGQINFNSNWKQFIKMEIISRGRLRHAGSCDCYIFTRDLYPKGHIPPFLLGRQLWDGWIVYDALKRKIATVDISSFKILHQTHMGKKYENLLPSQQWETEFGNNFHLSAGRKKKVDQVPYFWENNKLQRR